MNARQSTTYTFEDNEGILVVDHPKYDSVSIGSEGSQPSLWVDFCACPKHIEAIENLLAALKRKAGVPEPEPEPCNEEVMVELLRLQSQANLNWLASNYLNTQWTAMRDGIGRVRGLLGATDPYAHAPEPVMAEGGA